MLTKLKSIFFPTLAETIKRQERDTAREIIALELEAIRIKHRITMLNEQCRFLTKVLDQLTPE